MDRMQYMIKEGMPDYTPKEIVPKDTEFSDLLDIAELPHQMSAPNKKALGRI